MKLNAQRRPLPVVEPFDHGGAFLVPAPLAKRVVVVGGGFGGLAVARNLHHEAVEVTLIDRRNYHLFQPLLYQVATAALSPADIAEPIRRVLRSQENAQVLLGAVSHVDLDEQVVTWDGGRVRYDYLILAAGATHAYFGHEEWSARAPGLKTADDALEIRRRVLLAFESAEMEDDVEARRAELTFVVVGGGPTGVELAGALREIAVESIQRDFRRVDTSTARIVLVEGQSRLLGSMREASSRRALEDLERLGVEVRLNTLLTEMAEDRVVLQVGGKEEILLARNVIWAAGVRASSLGKTLGAPLDREGRVFVGYDCSIPHHANAFVIGDMASFTDATTGTRVPGVAQGALQMGEYVAGIIRRELAEPGAARTAFRYRDKGSMATIGRAKAVADVGNRSFGGLFAWILWSLIHVAFLVSFRNRLFVMFGWAWSYLAQVKGARLITGDKQPDVKRTFDF